MHRAWRAPAAVLLSSFLCACGNATPAPSDPAGAGAAAPPASASPASSTLSPAVLAGDEPKGRQRKPFPINNACSEVVTVVFGDDPKAPGAGRRTVASNSTIDGPRDADGKQTVWLLDDKGEPLVKVHVTRGMKQLEIGRSCRTLDAH